MGSCKSVSADSEGDDWIALNETNLKIAKGSAIDFSEIMPPNVPADNILVGPSGQFVLNNDISNTQRFFCAPYVFSAPHGFFPSKSKIDEIVLQLYRSGYNLIRFHFLDATLMKDAKSDFDFNSEQLDRLHYFLAKTKEYNIAWMIDAATSWNGADASVGKNRFIRSKNFNFLVHFDQSVQEHWKRLVRDILATVNPYTKIKTVNDPNLLIITTYNELGLNYQTNKDFPQLISEKFKEWLKNRGITYNEDRYKYIDSEYSSLLMTFFTETEEATSRWMKAYLAELGYSGLATSYNNGKARQALAARDKEELIAVHAYYDHPSDFFRAGSKIKNSSSIRNLAPYISYFSISREFGKPFIVDEYDQPYWNQYRREASVLVSAYAAFQGWDGICRFSNPAITEVGEDQPRRQQAMSPFATGVDPVSRAGEKLAALLFRRGDVSSSEEKVAFRLTDDFLHTNGAQKRHFPSNLAKLAFQIPVGNLNRSSRYEINEGFELELTSHLRRVQKALNVNLLNHHKEPPVIPIINRKKPIQNITRQLTLAPEKGLMTVITPRSEVALFQNLDSELKLKNLYVVHATGNAMVSVSSIDRDRTPIEESKRMLLLFITDAKNYNSTFSDNRRLMQSNGSLPILIKNEQISLKLKHSYAKNLSVYALNQQGMRVDKIQAKISSENTLVFELNLKKLEKGPTFYFEIAE